MNTVNATTAYRAKNPGLSIGFLVRVTRLIAQHPCRRRSGCCQHAIAINFECQVTQTNLGCRSDFTNGPYHQGPGSLNLNPEGMLNTTACLRASIVTRLVTLGQFLVATSFSLNMLAKTMFVKIRQFLWRSVSRIRPYIFAAVVLIQNRLKYMTIMGGRIGHRVVTDQFVFDINFYMILVAKLILAILLNPASISIFLAFLGIAPIVRNLPLFDLFVLLAAVALLGSPDNTRVNNLSLLGRKTILTQKLIELIKQFLGQSIASGTNIHVSNYFTTYQGHKKNCRQTATQETLPKVLQHNHSTIDTCQPN